MAQYVKVTSHLEVKLVYIVYALYVQCIVYTVYLLLVQGITYTVYLLRVQCIVYTVYNIYCTSHE